MKFNWVNGLKTGAKSLASKAGVFYRENGSTIEVYGGILMMISGGIWMAKQTLKLEDTIDISKKEIEKAKETGDKKTILKARAKACYRVGRLYAGPIAMELVGAGSIHHGYTKTYNNYLTMAGAFAASEQTVKNMEKNVRDMFGDEVANKVKYGLVDEVVETEEVDEETGGKVNKKTLKTVSKTRDGSNGSQFSFLCDELNIYPDHWENDIWTNLKRIQTCKSIAQMQYDKQGYLFLNEFLRIFGVRKEFMNPIGWKVGWIKPNKQYPHEMDYNNDGKIRVFSIGFGFGGEEVGEIKVENVYPYEPNLCLDPNVCGFIADRVSAMLAGKENY